MELLRALLKQISNTFKENMKTYYQLSTDQFAIAGVISISMSDEHYAKLKDKVIFLNGKSVEVQAYKAELAKREAIQAEAAALAQVAADEQEIITELLREQFGGKLKARIKEKQAVRQK